MAGKVVFAAAGSEERESLEDELESERRGGYDLTIVEDGHSLLAYLDTPAAECDLVLMNDDVERVGAIEALQTLRTNWRYQRHKTVPVIIRTTTADLAHDREIVELGGIPISKNTSRDFLFAVIERWCGQRRPLQRT